MDTEGVILFLALLAVACQVGVVAVLLLVASRQTPALGTEALWLGALIALVAMGGSLYLSEVANFTPCRLCWFQRFAMYPLGPILAVAAWRHSRVLRRVAAGLAGIGAAIATYHVLLERNPQWESSVCDPNNPCTLIWVEKFGYLTIPGMALSGFAAILALLALSRRTS